MLRNINKLIKNKSDAESDVRDVKTVTRCAKSGLLPQNAFQSVIEIPFKQQPEAFERSRFLAVTECIQTHLEIKKKKIYQKRS